MSEEKKSSVRKSPSLFLRVKKTLRQRSRESHDGKKKTTTSKNSERPKSDFPSRFLKSKMRNRKRSSDRNKSICSRTQKTNSKEMNISRSSHSREADSKSRMEIVNRSIDLEEDVGTPSSTDLMAGIRREEMREAEEKLKMKMMLEEKKKEEKKLVDKREDKKEEKKEEMPKPRTKSWMGMEAALNFFNTHNDILKIREEYTFLDSLTSNKSTEAFDANKQRNRDGSPKIYDDNRVKLNRPGHDDVNYINASHIHMKSFKHKLIVAQLPQFENESFVEDFWHMIYQEQITLVYLMVPEKALKNTPTSLFKEDYGTYEYVGKMFINNRRADVAGDPKEYTIEVLLEGNSDSVMCQVHHHSLWQHSQQPSKTRPIIKMIHQFLSEKQIQNANVCVLNSGMEPNICEIMADIKQQRPSAIESFTQYAGIYAIVLDYISRKRGSKRDPINKDINRFIDELTELSPAVSPTKEKPLH
ncbi:hypothetical protein L5515_008892 [Caenorhabditis briggsae]|uniref:Tyrosine-protein phosphatase domain-containing protein n=1 Tax=Caenorhabditis briggsae TaxID=6238 RepID=A0AAE9F8U6_CAEBR|nr:hypothetical protein L5515_008892 [Caenorhabditis briggsae]